MEEIIAPISKEIIKSELTEEKRLRFTNKSHNEIYITTAHESPNVMKEIGRLREIAFRASGGGTGGGIYWGLHGFPAVPGGKRWGSRILRAGPDPLERGILAGGPGA